MNRIWAPWRIKYVTKGVGKGCLFCRLRQKKQDEKNFIVFRSLHCFVLLNTYPYNNGHLMVVANRHIPTLGELKDKEILDINKTITKMVTALKKILKPQGFNIGINIGKFAGAGIENHLHVHIVPRWIGDTNFMPVISSTKIISQSLKCLYKAIKKVPSFSKKKSSKVSGDVTG